MNYIHSYDAWESIYAAMIRSRLQADFPDPVALCVVQDAMQPAGLTQSVRYVAVADFELRPPVLVRQSV